MGRVWMGSRNPGAAGRGRRVGGGGGGPRWAPAWGVLERCPCVARSSPAEGGTRGPCSSAALGRSCKSAPPSRDLSVSPCLVRASEDLPGGRGAA